MGIITEIRYIRDYCHKCKCDEMHRIIDNIKICCRCGKQEKVSNYPYKHLN